MTDVPAKASPSGSSPAATVVLDSVIDLVTVDHLREQLLPAIAADGTVVVDAHAVECLTTPGVQLLLAASRSAAECGQRFHLINPSETVVNVFGELGLSAMIEEWGS